jgi:WD40 repeat protein/DNA-binding SARP family transcriptional activator
MPRNLGQFNRPRLDFSVLGPLLVRGDSGPVDLPSPMERALLAHLVARAGRTVSTDELIDTLWTETPPRTAAKALQNHVLRLRNLLEPERDGSPTLLVTEGSGYRLDVSDNAIDARRFERLVGLGRRAFQEGRVEAAAKTLADALALWRGPAYAGLESTQFGSTEARRLEELRLVALEDRIAADLDLGRARETVAELQSLVHEHPLRERFWQLLVLALYRADRQADALSAYSRARDVLDEELGVEPSPELRRLQLQVLEQDSALLAKTRTPTLPDALVPPPGPFVGRVNELATLRAVWHRVNTGDAPATVVLRGPRAAGVTRLAAQFAAELADQGVVVEYTGDDRPSGEPATAPTLSVVDARGLAIGELESTLFEGPGEGPRLTVVLAAPSAAIPPRAETIDVGSLNADEVRAILATYVDDAAVDDVLPEVLRASGGLPGRVHDEALSVARQRAAALVSGAATWAGLVGSDLDAARADLRLGVTRYREVIERQLGVEPGTCPWKGLVAYGVADAPWFAGRERLVAELLTRLASARLVALVGGSGSGKSSLIHAGLLASLQAGALPSSESWVPLVMRPGPHPMRELVREALRGADRDRDRVAELLERVVFDEPDESRVVLIVDQFEEVWTACTDTAERESFLEALAEVVDSTSRCTVVLSVRADHVAGLADQPVLAQALADATVLIGTPTAAEVRRAVEHPAGLAGLMLDVGLADALVDDAGNEPGALPLLSTALTELWDHRDGRRLTLEAYAESGGLRGAVARIAERAYGELDEADRTAARVLLLRLAGPGEGDAVTRRRVPLAELAALPDPQVRTVVEPLAAARLLTFDAGYVEVAHEALFREWPRLRSWLEEHAAARAVQRRLVHAAAEWDDGGREPTELWRGGRLAAGVEFAAAYPDEVTTVERAFLDAGQAQLDAERREAEERAAVATKQNRRLRGLLGGLGVFLALALIAGGLAVRAQSRAEQETRTATARELAAAAVANLEADPELAVLLATRAVEHTREVDGNVLPEAEEALHRAVVSSRVVATYPSLGGTVAWSPDGSMFVSEGPEGTGMIDLRDPVTGESLRSWKGHDEDTNDVYFGRDGTLVTTGDDGAAVAWNPKTGTEVGRIKGPPGSVRGPSLSEDGWLLSAAWEEDGARVVDLRTGRLVREIRRDGGAASTALSPDGTRVAVGSREDLSVAVVDLISGRELLLPGGFNWGLFRLAWSPDGRWLAAVGDDHARVWDATTGTPRAVLRGHSTFAIGLAWSADSARIATGSNDGTAKIWELDDDGAREVLTLSGSTTHTGVVGVAFSPDGRRLMAGNDTISAVTIFDVSLSGDAEWANVPAPAAYTGVDFFPDGSRFVASSEGKDPTEPIVTAAIWDPETGRFVGETGSHGPPDDSATGTHVYHVEVSPDGTLIATATDVSVKVWDSTTRAEVFSYAPGGYLDDIAWSGDGSLLAVNELDNRVTTIFDQAGQKIGQIPEADGFLPISVAFSSDSAWLATGRAEATSARAGVYGVTVRDWRTGETVTTLDETWAESLAFSPDDSKLATSDPSIWDPRAGRLVAALTGQTAVVMDVEFSADGATVATSGQDGTVRLWNAESGVQRITLPGSPGDEVHAVAFSPDGTKLASTSADGVVRVWALDIDDLLRIAGENVTRGLTPAECLQYLHVDSCA